MLIKLLLLSRRVQALMSTTSYSLTWIKNMYDKKTFIVGGGWKSPKKSSAENY